MLTDADLDSMRATAAEALPGTAIIQTRSFIDDGGGGGTVGWTNAGTVNCRIAPMSGSEREIADRIAEDADFIFTLPTSATVTVTSRLVSNGGTFNVAAIRDRSYEITQRVEAVKVT
jgi:SPP1 family predicted phage head-tail adaptor